MNGLMHIKAQPIYSYASGCMDIHLILEQDVVAYGREDFCNA